MATEQLAVTETDFLVDCCMDFFAGAFLRDAMLYSLDAAPTVSPHRIRKGLCKLIADSLTGSLS